MDEQLTEEASAFNIMVFIFHPDCFDGTLGQQADAIDVCVTYFAPVTKKTWNQCYSISKAEDTLRG
jgi:hypothetical protein